MINTYLRKLGSYETRFNGIERRPPSIAIGKKKLIRVRSSGLRHIDTSSLPNYTAYAEIQCQNGGNFIYRIVKFWNEKCPFMTINMPLNKKKSVIHYDKEYDEFLR